MSTDTPSLQLRVNSNTHDDQLHLMPFSINYEGPAEISKYFITRSLPSSAEKDQLPDRGVEYLESSFRGRYLHGTQIKIPPGYLGFLCSSSAQSSSSTNHPPSAERISKPLDHLQKSSNSRPTTRGRGRARGRKLTQAIGTRLNSSLAKLKHKKQESDGFLSDDESGDDSADIKTNKPGDQENKEIESNNNEDVVKLADHTVSADREPVALQAKETLNQKVDTQTNLKPDLLDTPINLAAPETNLSASNLNDASHSDGPKIIQSIGCFDQLTIWNPDGPIDFPSDIYVRSIQDWVGLAQSLHSIPSPK